LLEYTVSAGNDYQYATGKAMVMAANLPTHLHSLRGERRGMVG
jgi:hypothetical protein